MLGLDRPGSSPPAIAFAGISDPDPSRTRSADIVAGRAEAGEGEHGLVQTGRITDPGYNNGPLLAFSWMVKPRFCNS